VRHSGDRGGPRASKRRGVARSAPHAVLRAGHAEPGRDGRHLPAAEATPTGFCSSYACAIRRLKSSPKARPIPAGADFCPRASSSLLSPQLHLSLACYYQTTPYSNSISARSPARPTRVTTSHAPGGRHHRARERAYRDRQRMVSGVVSGSVAIVVHGRAALRRRPGTGFLTCIRCRRSKLWRRSRRWS
jgi:hypothetical protein